MPRAVMALSSRYPQLLCILMRFFAETSLVTAVRIARIMPNDVATSTIFINSKPRFGLAGGSQGPLSGADAPCPARRRGKTAGQDNKNRRGRRLEAEVLSGR
jgi:hypothetical protein